MIRLYAFGMLQLLVLAYAVYRGGMPERLAAGTTSLALIAGWILPFDAVIAYRHVEVERLAIDTALFLSLLAIALWSDRFWPMWIAAVQLLAIGFHGVRAYDAELLPIAYNRLVGWLGYPILAAIWIGTRRHARRHRLRYEFAAGDK